MRGGGGAPPPQQRTPPRPRHLPHCSPPKPFTSLRSARVTGSVRGQGRMQDCARPSDVADCDQGPNHCKFAPLHSANFPRFARTMVGTHHRKASRTKPVATRPTHPPTRVAGPHFPAMQGVDLRQNKERTVVTNQISDWEGSEYYITS
jgi:hypothetical protein